MAFIRKIKGSLVRVDSADYVGEDSYLFYDIETGCLRRSDGTPGGTPICVEGVHGAVYEYPTLGDFPASGESDSIYIAADTNIIYRWDGSAYVSLSSIGSNNVEEHPNVTSFPPTGSSNVIYIDASNNEIYYWTGTAYQNIGTSHDTATAIILPGNTEILMTIPVSLNLSLKFLLSIVDNTTGEFAGAELFGIYKNIDNSVSHTLYSKLGDKIKYKPTLVYSAGNVNLTITNNDTNAITVSVTRVPTTFL